VSAHITNANTAHVHIPEATWLGLAGPAVKPAAGAIKTETGVPLPQFSAPLGPAHASFDVEGLVRSLGADGASDDDDVFDDPEETGLSLRNNNNLN
jgi:hypothetical protein